MADAEQKGLFLHFKPAPFRMDLPDALKQINKVISKGNVVPQPTVAMFIQTIIEFGFHIRSGIPCDHDQYWQPLQETFKAMTSKFKWDQKLRKNALQLDAYAMMSRIYFMKEDLDASVNCDIEVLKSLMATISRDTHSPKVADFMSLIIQNTYKNLHKTEHRDFEMLLNLVDRIVETYERKSLCTNDKVYAKLLETKMFLYQDLGQIKKGLKSGRRYLKFLHETEPTSSENISTCLFYIGSFHYQLGNYEMAYEVYKKVVDRTRKYHPNFGTDKTLLGHFALSLFNVEDCAVRLHKKAKDAYFKDLFEFLDNMPRSQRELLDALAIAEHLESRAVDECMKNTCNIDPDRVIRIVENDRRKFGSRCIMYVFNSLEIAQDQCELGNHFEAITIWENIKYLLNNIRGVTIHDIDFDKLWQCYAFHINYVPEALELADLPTNSDEEADAEPNMQLIQLLASAKMFEEAVDMAWEWDGFDSLGSLKVVLDSNIDTKYYRDGIRTAKQMLKHPDLKYDRFETVEEYVRLYESIMLKYLFCLKKVDAVDADALRKHFKKIAEKESCFGVKSNRDNRLIHYVIYFGTLDPFVLYEMVRNIVRREDGLVALAMSMSDKNTPLSYCKQFLNMTKDIFLGWTGNPTLQRFYNSLLISTHVRNCFNKE